jgi:hypothetical protein
MSLTRCYVQCCGLVNIQRNSGLKPCGLCRWLVTKVKLTQLCRYQHTLSGLSSAQHKNLRDGGEPCIVVTYLQIHA